MIEVVVALFILFLASSFVMSMFIVGGKAVASTEDGMRLNSLLQTKMDEVMSTRYDRLPSLVTPGTAFPRPNQDFKFSVAAEPFEPRVQKVTVKVIGPDGRERSWSSLRSEDPRRLGEVLYEGFGCVGCHSLAKVGANGKVGPSHDRLGDYAGRRKAGLNAEQYVKESVRRPDAFVVEGFEPFMSGLPLTTMSNEDLDALTDWLVNITTTPPVPPPPVGTPTPGGPPGPTPTPTPEPTPEPIPGCVNSDPATWTVCPGY